MLLGCEAQGVSIPNSVRFIGYGAFAYCPKPESIKIPESVLVIGNLAFAECSNLNNVTLLDSITLLGYDIFYGTPFSNNQTGAVKYAGNWVVSCDETTEPIKIKDGAIGFAIGFLRNVKSTSITIPNSVTEFDVASSLFYSSITDIYFNGTEEQWKKLAKDWNGVITHRIDDTTTAEVRPTVRFTVKTPAVTGVRTFAVNDIVILMWDSVTGTTQYVIKHSTGGKTWKTCTADAGEMYTLYTLKSVNDLAANTKYYFKAAAKNDKGTGAYSS